MAVCHHYRVQHSVFLAWPADDRDKAVAQVLRERRTCRCGTRPEEWDPARGGHREAYIPAQEHCRGCELIETNQPTLTTQDRGTRIVLHRNPNA